VFYVFVSARPKINESLFLSFSFGGISVVEFLRKKQSHIHTYFWSMEVGR
jgi:hypothetical protein